MKLRHILLSNIFLFIFGIGLIANPVDETINTESDKITLLAAIERISQEYEVYFTFDMTLVSDVEVEYEDRSYSSAQEAVSHILKGTNLKYKFYDHRFVILYREDAEGLESLKQMSRHLDGLISEGERTITSAPKREIRAVPRLSSKLLSREIQRIAFTVEGKVVDQDGEPLIGVNIQVKGSNKGTATDFDGNFLLEDIDENAILVITYVGYQSQEISIAGKSSLDIIMTTDSQLLDEVVVVGYGTQKKVNLTGAVSQVGADVLENRPITNVGQGLQGTIPNLNITQSTGTTGGGASFNIRGFTSINGGEPLILVDNVPMDINLINPNDIESISVLKDAASAAIYGARAAYGVILITTKSGSKEKKPKIALNTYYGMNTPVLKFETMDAMQRASYMNTASMMQNGSPYSQFSEKYMPHLEAYYNDPKNNPTAFPDPDNPTRWLGSANVDWPSTLLRNWMPQQQHSATISGGSENFNYYTSFSYFNQVGIPKQFDEKYERYNLMTNMSYDITQWMRIGSKISINNNNKTFPPNNSANHHDELTSGFQWHQWANYPIYSPDGKYFSTGSVPNMVQFHREGGYRNRKVNDIWLTGSVSLNPIKNLSFNIDYSTNINNRNEEDYWKKLEMYFVDGSVSGYYPYTNPSQNSKSFYKTNYYSFNAFANYSNSFGGHGMELLVGFNQENRDYSFFNARRDNLIIESLPFMNLAYGERTVGDGANQFAIRGGFSRVSYNFKDRYLLEFNSRYDGSSKFPKEDRFAFFPSFSAGWRLDNENFFQSIANIFDMLKLRASYGSLGNQNVPGNYPYIASYSSGQIPYILGGETPMTIYAPGLVSPTLTWEKVNQIDVGVDIALLANRLNLSFDIYRRDTKDMLTRSETLPAVLAVSEPQSNAADLRTKGWDIEIGFRPVFNKKLSWNLKVLLSDHRSTITRFSNPSGIFSDYYVGKDVGEIWGLVTDKIAQTDEEATSLDMSNIAGRKRGAGDLLFVDLNGDGKIDRGAQTIDNPGDMKIIGNNTPRYSFGIASNIEWRSFDINILFQGIGKRDLWLNPNFWIGGYNDEWRAHNVVLSDFWTPDNPEAYFPRPIITGGTDVTAVQTRWLQNGAYVRLKDLTIGYTLPQNLLYRININNVRIFISGNNIWEATGIYRYRKVADPEMAATYQTPINRTYAFGLNLGF